MINISDEVATVEGTVGIKKNIGKNCLEEESEDKNIYVNNSGFFNPYEILFLTQKWR